MITLDGWGVLCLMVFGWLMFNAAVLAGLSIRRHRSPEYRAIVARRRWLQALPREEWRMAGDALVLPVHEPCGQRHRAWEYCPVMPGGGGRFTADGDGG